MQSLDVIVQGVQGQRDVPTDITTTVFRIGGIVVRASFPIQGQGLVSLHFLFVSKISHANRCSDLSRITEKKVTQNNTSENTHTHLISDNHQSSETNQ